MSDKMNKNRVFNFSAGPSILPLNVLEDVQGELVCYKESGQSVMEMSHRSKEFDKIIKEAESDLRELMNIPENYKVMFIQGGGTLQFSMVALNFMYKNHKADYVITGSWAKKAMKEAARYGDVKAVASSEEDVFTYIPKVDKSMVREDADYLYICYNNTIYGTHYNYIPDVDIPIIADMSSCILSEEIDVSRFGAIIAGAQKNIGPAGVTIAIVREDLIGHAHPMTPVYLDYKTHSENDSLYNTPPCFAIYVAGLVFKDLVAKGGLSAKQKANEEKASKLYNYLDSSKLFSCPVAKEDRSIMNVVFVTGDKELDKKFIEAAKSHGLINLGGHRSIGGMRASIYNAMPEEGVDRLIAFMQEFEKANA